MLITEYPEILSLVPDNVFLLDGPAGTKKIKASNMLFELVDTVADPVPLKRSICRGKNLGSAVTDAQYNEINAGTFKGLFLGDYWEIGGYVWRIVDFDYWFGYGDTPCGTHHLVIMPDSGMLSVGMNDKDITTGAYIGSKMYTTHMADVKKIVNDAFTEAHILNHREHLQNAVTNGYASGSAWYNSTVELPNEPMMYGSYIFTSSGDGSVIVNRNTISKSQLSGMRLIPRLTNMDNRTYWLRDVGSTTTFAACTNTGNASYYYASNEAKIRPVFGIKK